MIKPTELRKLIAVLEEDHPDVETAAKAAFNLVEDLLNQRTRYVTVVVHPTLQLVQAVGPYDSKIKAEKDYATKIGAYDRQSYLHLALLKHSDNIEL
jgi:hypothetical protein